VSGERGTPAVDLPVSIGIMEHKRGRWVGRHIALDERSVEALKRRMNQLSK
jgi:hypothetical protein